MQNMRLQTFRRFAILALFAMVFNALAATVSYAMAAGKGVVVVEMCSSFGLKKIAVSTTDTQHSPSSTPVVKHCPFCLSPDHTTVVFQTANSATPVFVSFSLPSITAAWAPVHDPQSRWIAALKQDPPVRS